MDDGMLKYFSDCYKNKYLSNMAIDSYTHVLEFISEFIATCLTNYLINC